MTHYFDSSALVAIYVTETFSPCVREEARAAGQLPFTALHDLEVRNAFRAGHGRGRIDAAQLAHCLRKLDEDLDAVRLGRAQIDLFRLFDLALELSSAHTVKLLCRSLDLLHVAGAVELRCRKFVSGDDRQLDLAKAAGLQPIDIKKPEAEGQAGPSRRRSRASRRR